METQQSRILSEQPEMTAQEIPDNSTLPPYGETNHIDALINEYQEVEVESVIEQRRAELLDKNGFRSLFFGAGQFCYNLKKWETLKQLSPENSQAIDAVDAIYDSIYDIPQLHWILSPGNKWAQRGFAIGMFFVPFAIGIKNDRQLMLAKTQIKNVPFSTKEHVVVNLDDFKD